MTNKWNDKSWQKDLNLNMKSHSPSDAKLLIRCKRIEINWRLGVLHVEYERLKKNTL